VVAFPKRGASKRERASTLAARLGFTRLLERLPRRPSILIINYHRIGDAERDLYDRGLIEATAEEFDDQMAALKRTHRFTELAEVQEFVQHPSRLRHCLVLVTLDDGYRDNYDVAFPILRSHGIRAAFFLATGFVGTRRVPWWDQIAYVIRFAERRRLRLRYPWDESIDLDVTPADEAIERLLQIYKHPATADQELFLSGVEEACRVTRPQECPERLFMSWEEARELAGAGMGIGAHSHTHELLAKLTREQQLGECRLSREVIRENLGLDVDSFAFPVGSHDSFSAVTQECLRETGYRTAFSYYGGVNTPTSLRPFDVARVALSGHGLTHYRLKNALAAVTARELW
jgi:peptidoglycan/xylan/chitin deacetylase (PgdA/CDA1 family)